MKQNLEWEQSIQFKCVRFAQIQKRSFLWSPHKNASIFHSSNGK